MRPLFFTLVLILSFKNLYAQSKTNPETIREKMQWFADAKLGIFIHWGIYSVKGIDESWSFHNKKISYADYMSQLNGFTAKNYNPQAWADMISDAGARYAVITTKHHDGVALWDSKFSDLNVAKKTPAHRDVLLPFVEALRKNNVKVGTYFSILDWSHPDYTGFLKDSSRYKIKDDTLRWQRFVNFYHNQMNEMVTRFKPDVLWLDGDWEHTADEWRSGDLREKILAVNPKMIINGRLQGFGDYETPEQNAPVTRPNYKWWELCMTSNNNWGWQPQDTFFKTPFEIISIFADVIGNGGNLLLDIGPKEDGTFPPEQINLLKELGVWNRKHSEAVFNSLGGIPAGHFYGPTTLSKDSMTLYLFVPGKTASSIVIKGLDNEIKKARIVGTSTLLSPKVVGKISWSPVPGILYIDLPKTSLDKYMTVVALDLEKPIKLYRGRGGFD